MSRCPDCESDLELDGYEVEPGETMHCPECSTELVVVSTDPIVLRSPDPATNGTLRVVPAPRPPPVSAAAPLPGNAGHSWTET